MKLVSTPRVEFLRALATEILHNYSRGRTTIAVDGAPDPVREAFADDLARVLDERGQPSFRASLRYFQRSRHEQEVFGGPSPQRHYRFDYDYSALRRVLIEPFRMGGSTGFVTRHFDPDRDSWIEPNWLTAPPDATLVVDGEFVNRPELRGLWSYSVWLEGATRNADGAGHLEYGQLEEDVLYRAESNPRSAASVVVDLTDPAVPRRQFLDSC
ncbi:MAG: hypothetical protein JWQ68_2246 [Cryobacterium sp.]|jgi:uridine kinase|nr:hypothetical protein [Cryobacterium sp.]